MPSKAFTTLVTYTLAFRWRGTLIKPEVFPVRGINYVASMATDMGFLDNGLVPLKEDFGITFGNANPFALPCVALSIAHQHSTANHITAAENYHRNVIDSPARRSKTGPLGAKISRSKIARRKTKVYLPMTSHIISSILSVSNALNKELLRASA